MIFPWGEGISHGSAHGLPWQCSIVRSFPKPVFSFNFGVLHDFFLRSFPPALWNSQPLSGNQGGRDANARRPGKSQRATWNVGDWVSALTYFGSLWFISVSSASISISKGTVGKTGKARDSSHRGWLLAVSYYFPETEWLGASPGW